MNPLSDERISAMTTVTRRRRSIRSLRIAGQLSGRTRSASADDPGWRRRFQRRLPSLAGGLKVQDRGDDHTGERP